MSDGQPRPSEQTRKEDGYPHIPAGGGPNSQDPEPATHTTSQATAAPGTDRGQCQRDPRRVNVNTLRAKTPLTRENTCPRWDSNCIPTPANTGLPRKHAESDPIRPTYDPVRRPKCAQCAHPQLRLSEHPETRTAFPNKECGSSFAGKRGTTDGCARLDVFEHRRLHRTERPTRTGALHYGDTSFTHLMGCSRDTYMTKPNDWRWPSCSAPQPDAAWSGGSRPSST